MADPGRRGCAFHTTVCGVGQGAIGNTGRMAVRSALDPDGIDRGQFFPSWLLEGPTITTGRGVAAIPIAEYVMAAILGFEKRLHESRATGVADWGKGTFGSVYGKKVGIAGFGSIGRAVAERAR